nr:hypothetical protein Iba_scaffold3143CG0250 [Ipomoea batatas]GME12439.1 hypothetical protein Iba_scaffold13754CG0010 [Ipomoea batatas]
MPKRLQLYKPPYSPLAKTQHSPMMLCMSYSGKFPRPCSIECSARPAGVTEVDVCVPRIEATSCKTLVSNNFNIVGVFIEVTHLLWYTCGVAVTPSSRREWCSRPGVALGVVITCAISMGIRLAVVWR